VILEIASERAALIEAEKSLKKRVEKAEDAGEVVDVDEVADRLVELIDEYNESKVFFEEEYERVYPEVDEDIVESNPEVLSEDPPNFARPKNNVIEWIEEYSKDKGDEFQSIVGKAKSFLVWDARAPFYATGKNKSFMDVYNAIYRLAPDNIKEDLNTMRDIRIKGRDMFPLESSGIQDQEHKNAIKALYFNKTQYGSPVTFFFETATLADVIHEFGHHMLYQGLIPPSYDAALRNAFLGSEDGDWFDGSDRALEAKENMAEAFLQYVMTESPSDKSLKNAFDFMKSTLKGLNFRVKLLKAKDGMLEPGDQELNLQPDVKEFFDSIMPAEFDEAHDSASKAVVASMDEGLDIILMTPMNHQSAKAKVKQRARKGLT